MLDIFKPLKSSVVKDIEGKLILIYGTNRTGKTSNAVTAPSPLVVAFERGLNAIDGIPYAPISEWSQWIDVVKQLTGPRAAEAKELYKTIIVDGVDAMGDLAATYVCNMFGATSIGSGNRGYGLWREYSAEINRQLRKITNAGYTVIFLAHDGTRELLDEKGVKYDKIYPRGDKRVVDPICDLCDFICYAQAQPCDEKGEPVNSTLHIKGSRAYHAGSRFPNIVPSIPNWTMGKLRAAIGEAISKTEKASASGGKTLEEVKASEDKATASKWAEYSFAQLIELCTKKGQATIEQTGSPAFYQSVLMEEFGTTEFKASKATEEQRALVEQLLNALEAKGY